MTNQTDLVARIKADLVARGQTWRTNEDAFQITARVAWALRSEGAQLIVKTGAQNGAVYQGVKYSHDAIAFPTGWIDCLASAGPEQNLNIPAWGATGSSNAPLVAPFDLDATPPPVIVDPPLPPLPPLPPPVPPLPPAGNPDAIAWSITVLARAIESLEKEVHAAIDGQALNESVIMGALATLRSDVGDLQVQTARGVGGSLFGYPIRLKP